MSRYLIPLVFCSFCVSLISMAGCPSGSVTNSTSKPAKALRKPYHQPISIVLSAEGYIYQWRFTVDSKGNAFVSEGLSRPKTRRFKVSDNQLVQLRQALVKERFFELGSEYGDLVPDGGVARMRIAQGNKSKMVTLLFLNNWEREGHKKLAEAQRAERIWNLIKSWTE